MKAYHTELLICTIHNSAASMPHTNVHNRHNFVVFNFTSVDCCAKYTKKLSIAVIDRIFSTFSLCVDMSAKLTFPLNCMEELLIMLPCCLCLYSGRQ